MLHHADARWEIEEILIISSYNYPRRPEKDEPFSITTDMLIAPGMPKEN